MTAQALPRSAVAVPLPGTEFSVPAMRCAGCISKIEGQLPLVNGIAAARVNLTAKRVTVSHLPDITIQGIISAFADLGFAAQPVGEAIGLVANDESRDLLKAMAVAGFAMMNIMLLSVSVWSGAGGLTRDLFHWLSALIAMPTLLYSGRPFFRSAWAALSRRTTNMDVPISIGVILAGGLSLFETITHGPHAYFDGAVMLLFFLLTGRWLDSVMRDRARDGVTALLKNMATGAMILDESGKSQWIEAKQLKPGMTMLLAVGERLAADGVVTEGKTRFDLSLLTGESRPQSVTSGNEVHAGTLNLDAPIHVRVTASGRDTAIADIARLMEEAAQGKSRYVRIADRAARYYAPAVHTLAIGSFAGWMLAGAGWHASLLIGVAVLIITCPCALGLAVPAAQIVASGALMQKGVLVKDGSALERLAEVDLAFFDKTGTLTLGRPEPINLGDATPEQQMFMLTLARASRHPLSESLRRALEALGTKAAPITNISEMAGSGVNGHCDGQTVALNRPVDDGALIGLATSLFIDGEPAFTAIFEDRLRPDAKALIDGLKPLGVSSSILSGDRAAAVAPIARALGLTAQTAMLPADKLDAIARQTSLGHKVLMLGDGLNDGPALAAGHASIAPASASDAGQNAADIVIMGDSLMPVLSALQIARATQKVVRQNFGLAIGYNFLAVPLAIFGFVTPLIAALAMSISSLIVVANALRLKRIAR
jgi:P-type Cu2+ transporter